MLLAAESARSGSTPTKSTKSPMPTPARLSASSSRMASLSASPSPCTPVPVPELSLLRDELVDIVDSVRGRVLRTHVCRGEIVLISCVSGYCCHHRGCCGHNG